MTVAAFMDLALYEPRVGYYARAARRSGRAGDFFTSVDVGAMFGDLLEAQIAEMADLLASIGGPRKVRPTPEASAGVGRALSGPAAFDLVEAGAGNGRLSADILRAARKRHPSLYDNLRLHLVEASPVARAAQSAILEDTADHLVSSSDMLPSSFEGVLIANELLDALPVHQVVMREDGLREVYVTARRPDPSAEGCVAASGPDLSGPASRLVTVEDPPSTPALADYLGALGVSLEPGWRVEINLRAVEWVRDASRRLRRGFLILIDYGHEAHELYSETHSNGTLTTFAGHTMEGAETAGVAPRWLRQPGEQDITAHVDFTSVRRAAEAEGLVTVGFLDQTYFLMGLLEKEGREFSLKERLALKTLLMPGGLGSTLKVLILAKGIGTPPLRGCSYRVRVT